MLDNINTLYLLVGINFILVCNLFYVSCALIAAPSDIHMEGWLAVPNKQNIKKYGWKKQYVVVSSKKVLFYNSEADRQNVSDPVLVLDIE